MDREIYYKHLREIFFAGIKAVDPAQAIHRLVKRDGNRLHVGNRTYYLKDYEHIYVIGAGKASAPMARAMEEILGDTISKGIVIVKYGHICRLDRIEIVEAGHPVPDRSGLLGTRKIQDLIKNAAVKDLVFCMISGGGSALLPAPAEGITLEEKQEVTRQLLACGATIGELNAIRKHLSTIKGGQLARAAHPARLVSLILSDVVGDPMDVIASGPTVPDRSTFGDCMKILERYSLLERIPTHVTHHFSKGLCGEAMETPKADDPIFRKSQNYIMGNNLLALQAAREKARELGYHTLILSSQIEGDTREVALAHSGIVKEVVNSGNPIVPPACILSGGETTVTLRGKGLGGRNQEFCLALALSIQGTSRIFFLSAGTDGTDGPTEAAGAFADGETIERATRMGMDARAYLDENNSYPFFESLGDLFKTGPTNTNVMDLRICIVA